MSYSCGFGCTRYDPSCDACDDAVTSDNEYEQKDSIKARIRAGIFGQTYSEYIEDEKDNDDDWGSM